MFDLAKNVPEKKKVQRLAATFKKLQPPTTFLTFKFADSKETKEFESVCINFMVIFF